MCQLKSGQAIACGADVVARRRSGAKIYATTKKGFPSVRYMIKDRIYVPCIRTTKTISFSTSGKLAVIITIAEV